MANTTLPATKTGGVGGSQGGGGLRKLGNVYRPQGVKQVQTGIAFTKGALITLNGMVDLSVPVVGFRFVLKGRVAVGTADYTSVKPEQLLNLIKEIKITGINTRAGGNVTLFDLDSATWCGFTSLVKKRPYFYLVNKAAGGLIAAPEPGTPYFAAAFVGFDGVHTGAPELYDFIIAFDVPMYPMHSSAGFRAGWALRKSEWNDSIQIQVQAATLADAAENEIGVSAATTTTTLYQYGASSGNPTLDVYVLTNIMGVDLAPTVLPGVLSRVAQPLSSIVQTTGTNIAIIQQAQKQVTGRFFVKTGVATLPPNYSSLSDSVLTALGIVVGANRYVRNINDVFAHKMDMAEHYGTQTVQGYFAFDFLQSDSPFSAYPGQSVGAGATFQLVANVTGAANQGAIVVQEQHLFEPDGPLYAQ
jgi:hypothetical protein